MKKYKKIVTKIDPDPDRITVDLEKGKHGDADLLFEDDWDVKMKIIKRVVKEKFDVDIEPDGQFHYNKIVERKQEYPCVLDVFELTYVNKLEFVEKWYFLQSEDSKEVHILTFAQQNTGEVKFNT